MIPGDRAMLKPSAPLMLPSDAFARPLAGKDHSALVELLSAWEIPEGSEQAVHDMALAGLSQVKGSTEYDDARALLTIVAFLTALAGAVFTRFSSTYELPSWSQMATSSNYLWPALTYAMFGAYAVIVAISAYVIFGAMKPTTEQIDRPSRHNRTPQVLNFHGRIAGTRPEAWGQNFVDLTTVGAGGRDTLTAHYAKHYILETYLVAEKIDFKLKKAAPAVRWLQLSMLFLAGFIVSYGTSLIFLAPAALK
jgi:hypothetical protein